MKYHVTFLLASIFVSLASLQVGAAEKFEVDTGHSSILLKVQHNGAGYSWGRFNDFDGSVVLDGADSEFEFTVKTATIDTGNEKRDDHLKGPDFFNVKQFPVATFKSSAVSVAEEGVYQIGGKLMIHGVTKAVKVDLKVVGESKNRRGQKVLGLSGKLMINRSDFGVDYMPGGLGEEVKIILDFEVVAK